MVFGFQRRLFQIRTPKGRMWAGAKQYLPKCVSAAQSNYLSPSKPPLLSFPLDGGNNPLGAPLIKCKLRLPWKRRKKMHVTFDSWLLDMREMGWGALGGLQLCESASCRQDTWRFSVAASDWPVGVKSWHCRYLCQDSPRGMAGQLTSVSYRLKFWPACLNMHVQVYVSIYIFCRAPPDRPFSL